jgi:hypothetical protein
MSCGELRISRPNQTLTFCGPPVEPAGDNPVLIASYNIYNTYTPYKIANITEETIIFERINGSNKTALY